MRSSPTKMSTTPQSMPSVFASTLVALLGRRAAGEHQGEARPWARREGLAYRVAEGSGDVVDGGDHGYGAGVSVSKPCWPDSSVTA